MPKIDRSAVPVITGTKYPPPHDAVVKGRAFQRLGDAVGLTQFGVNLVTLAPGVWSSQRHWHHLEDEFVYVVEGELTLATDAGEELLRAGDCAGFKAGVRDGHCLKNLGERDAVFLAIGTRDERDHGEYSDIDMTFGDSKFLHKDGTPY